MKRLALVALLALAACAKVPMQPEAVKAMDERCKKLGMQTIYTRLSSPFVGELGVGSVWCEPIQHRRQSSPY